MGRQKAIDAVRHETNSLSFPGMFPVPFENPRQAIPHAE
jgi:hypothetical protein